MKHTMTKWLSAIALLSFVACSKVDIPTENLTQEKGVFGYLTPFVDEDAATRGNVLPDDPQPWKYVWEVGDEINIWSSAGTTLFYSVAEVNDDRATFDGGGFTLTEGETYYSFHPMVLTNKVRAVPVTFEDQVQDGNNNGKHLADYIYSYASGTCTNGNTSFQYHNLVDFLRFVVTLPEEGMTIKKLTITADKDVFITKGTVDVTASEATIASVQSTNEMTLTLNNVTVADKDLRAFMASSPLSQAANYVIKIEDSEGNVYTSEPISKGVYPAGRGVRFEVTFDEEEYNYVKVTSIDADPTGQYILVYPEGTNYRVFSFLQAMENAETAAASVSDVSGLDNLFGHASPIYSTVIGNDYITVTGEADATRLFLTPEEEAKVALAISANTTPWITTAPAKDLKTTLSATTASGKTYTVPVDHLVGSVNGSADLVAAFNAPGVTAAMNTLRGHNVSVTFGDVVDLAIAETDGLTASDAFQFKYAVKFIADAIKGAVEDHPEIFGTGTMMDIDATTQIFPVFSQYYDNVANLSWAIDPEKRFGLATIGFDASKNGFTYNVNLPSYEWFTRMNNAFRGAVTIKMVGGNIEYSTDKDAFINYWAAFDADAQYDVKFNGVKIENFYQRVANRLWGSMIDLQILGMYNFAMQNKITKLGQTYKTFAEKLNADLAPVYIFKKVE